MEKVVEENVINKVLWGGRGSIGTKAQVDVNCALVVALREFNLDFSGVWRVIHQMPVLFQHFFVQKRVKICPLSSIARFYSVPVFSPVFVSAQGLLCASALSLISVCEELWRHLLSSFVRSIIFTSFHVSQDIIILIYSSTIKVFSAIFSSHLLCFIPDVNFYFRSEWWLFLSFVHLWRVSLINYLKASSVRM